MSPTEAVRSTVYIESDLHHALRLKSAQRTRSMADIVDEALRQALREDQEDLAAVRGRAKGRLLSCEDFLARLKADGTL